MRARSVRSIAFVAVVFSILLVAQTGPAQVAATAPACCAPAPRPQTVYGPLPVSASMAGVGYAYPTTVTTYYIAPAPPPPNVVQYYPQYEVGEGPIRRFFRQLLEPLSLAGGLAPTQTVAIAQPVAFSPGFSALSPVATAPPSFSATVLKPPVVTTYGTGSSYLPGAPSSTAYYPTPPPVTVTQTAPSYGVVPSYSSSALTGVPTPAAGAGVQLRSAPPAEAPPLQRSVKPNVRVQYNEERKDLPSTSLRYSHGEAMQAAHLRDAADAAAEGVVVNQPDAAGSAPPDASGWRSVP